LEKAVRDVGEGDEEKKESRVSTDESLSAVSDDLDKLTRMLGTCLSPVSRVNFASLYAISLSFSFSPFLASSSMHRYRGSAAPLSEALNGTFVDPSRSGRGTGNGTTTVDLPVWTSHVIPFARKGESEEGWGRRMEWRTEREDGTKKEGRKESPFLR